MIMEALNAFKRINKLNLHEPKQTACMALCAQCAYKIGWLVGWDSSAHWLKGNAFTDE